MISFLCLYPQINFAGGGGEPVEAPVYDELLNQISMREAEMLWQAGIPFYDVNTLEVWTQGYIPGAKFFNVRNWKKLLPENKDQTMVFYCVNKLCTASEMAAREVMKLGYTDVLRHAGDPQGARAPHRKVRRHRRRHPLFLLLRRQRRSV